MANGDYAAPLPRVWAVARREMSRLNEAALICINVGSELGQKDWDCMYRATTHKIQVTVKPRFMSERSSPERGHFFWAYTIEIANNGKETVQLKTRYWHITDAMGRIQEVRGAGVVGEEPVLAPGETFEYTSGVPLPTPSGFMTGHYGMVTDKGENFDIEVPAFSLDSAESGRTLN